MRENFSLKPLYLFVDFFFILSGFIISYVYAYKFDSGFKLSIYKKFLILRFGRLYPLHLFWLVILLGIIISASLLFRKNYFEDMSFTVPTLISHLFLAQGLGLFNHLSWNYPSWSISSEFFCYIFFPALLLLARRKQPFLWLFLLLLVVGGYEYLIIEKGSLDLTFNYPLPRTILGFMLGILAYRFYDYLGKKLEFTGFLHSFLVISLAISFYYRVEIFTVLLFFGIVLTFSRAKGKTVKVLNHPILLKLGEISYSLYLAHWVCYAVFKNAFEFVFKIENIDAAGPLFVRILFTVCYFASAIITALLTYKIVELPARSFFRKRIKF